MKQLYQVLISQDKETTTFIVASDHLPTVTELVNALPVTVGPKDGIMIGPIVDVFDLQSGTNIPFSLAPPQKSGLRCTLYLERDESSPFEAFVVSKIDGAAWVDHPVQKAVHAGDFVPGNLVGSFPEHVRVVAVSKPGLFAGRN